MTARKFKATIHLWGCEFASQQLAFAHLLDVSDRTKTSLDLDEVEVITGTDKSRRLAPYFEVVPSVPSSPMLVLLACPEGACCPFEETEHLTYIGAFAGHVRRVGAHWG